MIHRRTWQGILALAVVAAATGLLMVSSREPDRAPPEDLDTRLSYSLRDFDAVLMDEQGTVSMRVDAPLLRNNASTRVGAIELPNIRVFQPEDEWHIRADSAIITADREFVSLVGQVDLQRINRNSQEVLSIQTRDLLLEVTPRLASTDAAVSIHQNQDWVRATGMSLNMKTNYVQLLSEVRARYALD